jgi:DNA-binding transcriptional MerR regulator
MLEVKPPSGPAHSDPETGLSHSDPETGLSIAEAARRTGVSVHTLRYYERAGLSITTIDRNAGGRRRYQPEDLTWITMCMKLRATGMPIKTIQRYAQLVAAGHGNEQERLALMEAHRADVTAKLAEVEENLKLIDHKIDVYRGRLATGDADRLWTPDRSAQRPG